MNAFTDFLPVAAFFVALMTHDIFVATGVLIVATLVHSAWLWKKQGKLENMQWAMLIGVTVFGGATLLLRDEAFIQWKPTILNWLFSLIFIATQFIGRKPLVEHIMGSQIQLPGPVWQRLNLLWAGFFLVMGAINLYVVYNYSIEIWGAFKLFGMLGLTLVFAVIQMLYLFKYLPKDQKPSN